MNIIKTLACGFFALGSLHPIFGQDIHLHVNTEWEECSIQLDSSLSQESWHQFAQEAGRVIYFRPLTGASTLQPGRFELALLQWNTGINEHESAWNETFVHPDTTHYLIGGESLPIPGLTLRAGLTEKMDAGIFWTMSPGANYKILGAQVQYNILQDTARGWAVAGRAGFSSLYGPDDLRYGLLGIDAVASKSFYFAHDHLGITPYVIASADLAHAHEKSEVVQLEDENIISAQGALGLEAKIYCVRLDVEYNMSVVNTLSYKLGVQFKF